ncbi:molybdate ABC transporter permease subunit [Laceyella putida]|uniref:Molybdenum transport system permease n=1 Tax=Laceyella putida TaxID=110101 RepID=A0ABW2RFP2_9BACL
MTTGTQFLSPILLSLQVSSVASLFVFVLALFAAWMMKRCRFAGKGLLETLFILPLVLPPTVVGFGLLLLLGRRSWLGRFMEWLFSQPLVFTWWAAVIAAVVVAFPLVYQTIKTGFASIDADLEDAARSMGASERQVFRYVTLPLARKSLITGYLLGFARALGEFGATMMVAGNIPGKTQTIPTAIYIAVEAGDMELAAYWVLAIVFLSFGFVAVTLRLNGRNP